MVNKWILYNIEQKWEKVMMPHQEASIHSTCMVLYFNY